LRTLARKKLTAEIAAEIIKWFSTRSVKLLSNFQIAYAAD